MISVAEARAHFSRLLKQVEAGEEIVICRRDKPVARLVPFAELAHNRVPGRERGRIRIAEDFDVSPPELLCDFE